MSGRNPFFGEVEPEPATEPVNPFLYPERIEERAVVAEEEPEVPVIRRAPTLRLPRKIK